MDPRKEPTRSTAELKPKAEDRSRRETLLGATVVEPPGSHNRPLLAEEEYRSLNLPRRSNKVSNQRMDLSSSSATSSSYVKYLQQRQRDDKDSSTEHPIQAPDILLRSSVLSTSTPYLSKEKPKSSRKHRNVVDEVANSLRPNGGSSLTPQKATSMRQHKSSRDDGPTAEITSRRGVVEDLSTVNNRIYRESNEAKFSRELRSQRLRQQQVDRTSFASTSAASTGLHSFPFDKDARESRVEHGKGSQPIVAENVTGLSSSIPEGPVVKQSNVDHGKERQRSLAPEESSALHPSRSNVQPNSRIDTIGGLMTHSGANAKQDRSTSIGWSTLVASRGRQSLSMAGAPIPCNDESDSHTVNQYLAQRSNPVGKVQLPRLTALPPSETAASLKILRSTTSASFDEDDSSSSDEESCILQFVDDAWAEGEPEWSVGVSVLSGVDFPAPLVPNLPVCPVIRLGLVSVEEAKESPKGELLLKSKVEVYSTSPKVLSKRDNGSLEVHETFRWDGVRSPEKLGLVIELYTKAVYPPRNMKESPLVNQVPKANPSTRGGSGIPGKSSAGSTSRTATNNVEDVQAVSGIGSLFRRPTKKSPSEMETANAAAAVAKLLVEGSSKDEELSQSSPLLDSKSSTLIAYSSNQSEVSVNLRRRNVQAPSKMTRDLFVGSKVIPLSSLPLARTVNVNDTARIEQWYQLTPREKDTASSNPTTYQGSPLSGRYPSVLLEVALSSPTTRDESEDEAECERGESVTNASFAKRASQQIRSQLQSEDRVTPVKGGEELELAPGVVDFVCVVGARDIGDQKLDEGSSGWVNTSPDCCVLEQFPDDQYHVSNGRQSVLPNKVEWFCFPEGCRLWRGVTPPNLDELNLKRFSASSPANISTSIASFDACLGCTTSFSWFVISSHAEEYGSENSKVFGAVIRFFVPAPAGIDRTQDDFAQNIIPGDSNALGNITDRKRFWVPMGICITSSLPLIGTLEAILLRLCEVLAAKGISGSKLLLSPSRVIHEELVNLIFRYQRPVPGVVHCSIPFLNGSSLHLSLPPLGGLPALPHGNAITSVCRLLGADGFILLLSALLTECKIIIHSDDVANLCLVSEVMVALIFPFVWSLPYIPVLPVEMMEFIEAPLSYLLGVPSCNLKLIDPHLLEDIVIVDLDKHLSLSGENDGAHATHKSKCPIPLPASVTGNLSRSVYQVLKFEELEDVDDDGIALKSRSSRSFPRLEPETPAERSFRISVAVELCGLVRGYQDCLLYATSSQPIFNIDKFLQIAPSLLEEQQGTSDSIDDISLVLSPRSRRFMSVLVSCQHFHQFLEILDSEKLLFFHEVMSTTFANDLALRRIPKRSGLFSLNFQKKIETLSHFLLNLENKIPTYRVQRHHSSPSSTHQLEHLDQEESAPGSRFPHDLLQQINFTDSRSTGLSDRGEGVKQVSIEYLMELEKNPWRYQRLFDVDPILVDANAAPKVRLRDAIGERRYQAWKLAIEQEKFDCDEMSVLTEDVTNADDGKKLELRNLMAHFTAEMSTNLVEATNPNGLSVQQQSTSVNDLAAVQRCLEWALSDACSSSREHESDLLENAANALQNPTARQFVLYVLSQRGSNQKDFDPNVRRRTSVGFSKLEPGVFRVLLHLVSSILDSCVKDADFDSAFGVLRHTTGMYTITGENENEVAVMYLTEHLALHRIFADLGLWERAKELHFCARMKDRGRLDEHCNTNNEDDEYEATVATLYDMLGYGIPTEDMACFASKACYTHGWFVSDRGHTLMLLAKRLAMRRDQGHGVVNRPKSDIELMFFGSSGMSDYRSKKGIANKGSTINARHDSNLLQIYWCHPAAQSSRRLAATELSRRPGTQSLLSMLDEKKILPDCKRQNPKLMKRSPVTCLACLGSHVVVSGSLDGGVFLARRSSAVSDDNGATSMPEQDMSVMKGVHLDWGSSGSRFSASSASTSIDGEYGVGAVSCLATTSIPGMRSPNGAKDRLSFLTEDQLLEAVDGCRIIAGTTCGDLRVWVMKDVFSSVFFTNSDQQVSSPTLATNSSSSKLLNAAKSENHDFSFGSSMTRLKFSLRGRALSGHRGGVTCIDVPSQMYRPDTVVSGGVDGLIKIWNLRSQGLNSGRKSDAERVLSSQSALSEARSQRTKASQTGDALCILSGHGGRILCIKSAWHGDRLLSGGADRTVRVWDTAGGNGKSLLSLTGHMGWVTHVRPWGANTVVSGSTDRSVSLWDIRVRNTPLFALRHHHAPISDILVGARTDPYVFTASGDGSIALWDFRFITRSSENNPQGAPDASGKHSSKCTGLRRPLSKVHHQDYCHRRYGAGPSHLGRGFNGSTIMFAGSDAIIREWDYSKQKVTSEHATGHSDLISSFSSVDQGFRCDTILSHGLDQSVAGIITSSWDGTVRMSIKRQPSSAY